MIYPPQLPHMHSNKERRPTLQGDSKGEGPPKVQKRGARAQHKGMKTQEGMDNDRRRRQRNGAQHTRRGGGVDGYKGHGRKERTQQSTRLLQDPTTLLEGLRAGRVTHIMPLTALATQVRQPRTRQRASRSTGNMLPGCSQNPCIRGGRAPGRPPSLCMTTTY